LWNRKQKTVLSSIHLKFRKEKQMTVKTNAPIETPVLLGDERETFIASQVNLAISDPFTWKQLSVFLPADIVADTVKGVDTRKAEIQGEHVRKTFTDAAKEKATDKDVAEFVAALNTIHRLRELFTWERQLQRGAGDTATKKSYKARKVTMPVSNGSVSVVSLEEIPKPAAKSDTDSGSGKA
jgi:hypothetical protein